ncbi:hypothetical protein MKA58_16065, partial [[Clostridium] innocuum]|nr:hypothetical protein [[Clostridium] innocuum]
YNIEKLFYQIISKKKSPLKQGLSSVGRLNSSLNFMVLTSKHGDVLFAWMKHAIRVFGQTALSFLQTFEESERKFVEGFTISTKNVII